jgi:hypothetical protein
VTRTEQSRSFLHYGPELRVHSIAFDTRVHVYRNCGRGWTNQGD